MKTIREVAEELDVSKTTIRNHLSKLPDNLSVTKKGNILYLDTEVEAFIKDRVQKVSDNNAQNGSHDTYWLEEKIKMLEEQNEEMKKDNDYLREQMGEKNKQITDYARLLDQQQQLQLSTKQELLEYKEQNQQLIESKEYEESKGFWARLFGK